MPHGAELLRNEEWQPVPGARELRIYPYLRRIDTISSNSFIIDGPELIVCIDPGGLPDQADRLAGVIAGIREEHSRRLLVILTHVHIDHSLQAMYHPAFRGGPGVVLAVQEKGVEALERGDARMTVADLLGKDPEQISVGLPLLPEARGPGVTVPPVNITEGSFALRGERVRYQGISLGGGELLRVFRTPGHTPDSISLRAGNILFLGDLIFAANPGFAGMPGWSQEDLLRSLGKVSVLLEEGGIAVCCPGHGKPLTPAATLAILGRMATEAGTLSGIAEVSPAWARETAAYAENLVAMENELFTVLSGRLYLVAHVLEELDESGEAERLKGIITAEAIDGIIADFHGFSEEYRQGKRLDFHLTLKAGQIIQKLHHAFDPATLATVVDASLLRRAERLLSDYMTRFRGFTVRPEMETVDPNGLIREVLENAGRSPWSGEAIIEAADSGERYLEALVSRIAHPPVFEDTRMVFTPGAGVPPVVTDPDRFSDLVNGILEEFAGRGMTKVCLTTIHQGAVVRLTIEAQGGRTDGLSHGDKVRFFREECRVLSGNLAVDASGGRVLLAITLPVQIQP